MVRKAYWEKVEEGLAPAAGAPDCDGAAVDPEPALDVITSFAARLRHLSGGEAEGPAALQALSSSLDRTAAALAGRLPLLETVARLREGLSGLTHAMTRLTPSGLPNVDTAGFHGEITASHVLMDGALAAASTRRGVAAAAAGALRVLAALIEKLHVAFINAAIYELSPIASSPLGPVYALEKFSARVRVPGGGGDASVAVLEARLPRSIAWAGAASGAITAALQEHADALPGSAGGSASGLKADDASLAGAGSTSAGGSEAGGSSRCGSGAGSTVHLPVMRSGRAAALAPGEVGGEFEDWSGDATAAKAAAADEELKGVAADSWKAAMRCGLVEIIAVRGRAQSIDQSRAISRFRSSIIYIAHACVHTGARGRPGPARGCPQAGSTQPTGVHRDRDVHMHAC